MSQPGEHLFLDKTCSINQLLPVEILAMILLFVGPPSFKNPYVYLPLTWVCRRWRFVVLGHSKFWSVLGHKGLHDISFIQKVILRSKSSRLDVFSCPDNCSDPSCISPYITSESSRIKTLLFRDRRFFREDTTDWSTLSFPQLENLIFPVGMHYLYSPDKMAIQNLFRVCRPRYTEISCPLYNWMSQGLSHVEWLKLDYAWPSTGEISIVLNILKNLPNLKILNLISNKPSGLTRAYLTHANRPSITLPNLRMFSLDIGDGEFCSIQTPTLDYFAASHLSPQRNYNWDHLDGVDLSMTKSFRIALNKLEPLWRDWELSTYPSEPSVACISTGNLDSGDDCQLFENFHMQISRSGEVLDNCFIPLPPKNSFHVSFEISVNSERLFHSLKRATNLVELTLDYRRQEPSFVFQSFLTHVLTTFDTVVNLTILRGRSFVAVSTLLVDGRTVPRLERLTYHSSSRIQNTDFVFNRTLTMQDARSKASCHPLKFLELRNFAIVPPERARYFEALGIQLIQT